MLAYYILYKYALSRSRKRIKRWNISSAIPMRVFGCLHLVNSLINSNRMQNHIWAIELNSLSQAKSSGAHRLPFYCSLSLFSLPIRIYPHFSLSGIFFSFLFILEKKKFFFSTPSCLSNQIFNELLNWKSFNFLYKKLIYTPEKNI